jgi:hypothetical protein
MLQSGYFRAKLAQENLIKASSVPHSIVHATQFYVHIRKGHARCRISELLVHIQRTLRSNTRKGWRLGHPLESSEGATPEQTGRSISQS